MAVIFKVADWADSDAGRPAASFSAPLWLQQILRTAGGGKAAGSPRQAMAILDFDLENDARPLSTHNGLSESD
jgi:hypothetical protein